VPASPTIVVQRLNQRQPSNISTKQAENTAMANIEYKEWSTLPEGIGDVQMPDVMRSIDSLMPADTIVTNGAGNYTVWVHRFYRFTRFRSQLAPISGSMGYGLPAAVAAARISPDRPVICFAGDGCFLMHGQELATARKYNLNLIILIVNNGMYGTIRMHQERNYPDRVSATELTNPNFGALARAYGCHGEVVKNSSEFTDALKRAMEVNGPALIELPIDPEALTPQKTLSDIRNDGRKLIAVR
jgi:acetolactate synthase-1/2/3 large subunit